MTPLPNLYPGVSKPLEGAQLRVLLNGIGVQSVTMFLMAERGIIGPKPDYSLTSDTGDESEGALENLRLLQSPNMAATIPMIVTLDHNLAEDFDEATSSKSKRFPNPPFFVRNDDGSRGILRRKCTRDYKIKTNLRQIKRLLGIKASGRLPKTPVVEQWLGITVDEAHRMEPARESHIYNRYPLIEIGYSRSDCINWLWREYGIRAASSGCKRCPFRSDAEWLEMKLSHPDDFEIACRADEAGRHGLPGVRQPAFIHDSLRPLREIDFEALAEARLGQLLDVRMNACGGSVCHT